MIQHTSHYRCRGIPYDEIIQIENEILKQSEENDEKGFLQIVIVK